MPEAATADNGASADTGAAAAAAAASSSAAATTDKGSASARSATAGKADGGAAASSTDSGKGNGSAAPAWPDDWVTRMAKGDEKVAKQFSRYASPEALAEAHISLRRRLDSGEFRTTLPKDPKPEELAQWRKDNGIPEKPDGYDLKGIEFDDSDKPIVESIVSRLHAVNADPKIAREAVSIYKDIVAQNEQQREELDEQQRTSVLDTLNAEYGNQFRRNINLIEGTVLSKFPASVREAIKSARLPDGTALFNHPDAVRAFVALALEMNPAAVVTPGGTGDIGKGMVEEWQAIQKVRAEERTKYNKDENMQKRERELIDAMIRNGLMDEKGQLVGRKAA